MRSFLRAVCAFSALLALAPSVRADDRLYHHRVLLLNSYHQNLEWTADLTRGVAQTLAADPAHRIDLMVENMDTKRISTPEYLDHLADIYRLKYTPAPPDLIIVADNNAFSFLIERRSLLFPGVPVVFCGVNDFTVEMLKGEAGITGVPEVPRLRSTVDLALSLLPKTSKVLVIHDFLPTGLAWKKETVRQLAGLGVEVEYAPQFSREKLLALLARLPAHTLVLLTVYFQDGVGGYFPPDESLELMAKVSTAPIFGSLDFQLNHGIVGGDLIGGALQGAEAARMALRILEGDDPASIPIGTAGASALMFDWEQLRRFRLDPDDLPSGSAIVNHPAPGMSVSPVAVALTLGLLLLEAVIVTLLALNIVRRRRAERSLRDAREDLERRVQERTRAAEEVNAALHREVAERRGAMESLADSEERYRQMFHLNSAVKLLIDPGTGDILEANEAAARFYGYRRDNLLTMKITDLNVLSPDEVRHEMEQAKSQRRIHFNFRHRLASGEIRDVEVYSGPMKVRDQTLLFSIILDATDRRRAEASLAASEEEFHWLFDHAPMGIARLDEAMVIVRANPAMGRLFGCPPEALQGKRWEALLHPDDRAKPIPAGERTVWFERRGIDQEGRTVPLRFVLTADREEAGRPLGFVVMVEGGRDDSRPRESR